MSTHSITHSMTHGPAAFAAAAAIVSALAVGAVVVSQDDTGSPVQNDPTVQQHQTGPNHPGKHYPPPHGGTTQVGLS
jgi:hypothetical protein